MPDLEKLHEAVIEGDWKTAAAATGPPSPPAWRRSPS